MTTRHGRPIVVVGSSNTDMIIKTTRLPGPGETVLGGRFLMAPGGKGANQAVAAARAGGRVHFIARVGGDLFGDSALQGFRRDDIHVNHVLIDDGAHSGIALIIVNEDGENSIAVASGANARLSPDDVRRARDTIGRAGILLVQLEIPMETVEEAVRIAAEFGAKVIMNPAPARALNPGLLQRIDYLTPNENEIENITGIRVEIEKDAAAAARLLLQHGVKTVLITLGHRGVYVAGEGIRKLVPGFQVEAVDSTAAGDVFCGALAVGVAENKPLLDAVRFANAAAAISVTRMGAQPSAPNREEIEAFLGARANGQS
ncbi:MAG: ribokinase [Candidatus Aminicenantes bacterium]|nr:ribokinase [Candidatus Aminicenantes bacterium]